MAVDLEHGAGVTAERHVIGFQLEAAVHSFTGTRSEQLTHDTAIASSMQEELHCICQANDQSN